MDESAPLLNEHIDREAAAEICVLDIEADVSNDLLEQQALQSSSVGLIFPSLYIGMFLAALDGTVVVTLLAHISSEFHEFRSVSWIATAYLIAVSACQPLYGKLSDILGRKTLILFSNATFAIGCVFCGIANNIWFLVFARIIAGIGGAGLTSLSSITLNDLIALGWRWAFLLQVPFIVVSSVAIYFNLKSKPTPVSSDSVSDSVSETTDKLSRIDFAGSITLVLSLVLYLLGLSIGGNYVSWFSFPVFVAFFLGTIFLAAFIYVELYIAKQPVVPIILLKDRTIFGASFTNWLIMMINYTQLFYVPIYFIAIRGISPTQAGTNIIPSCLGSALGAIFSGTVMRTTGRYWWITTFSAFILTFGLATPRGLRSCTGSTVGVAIASAIFQNVLGKKLDQYIVGPDKSDIISRVIDSIEDIDYIPGEYKPEVVQAYLDAFHGVFYFAIFLAATVISTCGMMKEHVLHRTFDRK
ncbi:major facilitator superfamily domain-containing protein [Lipomyces mesembrius]